jgi:hypothetical protein
MKTNTEELEDFVGLAIVLFVLFWLCSCGNTKPVYQITKQANNYEVGITCNNNGDPTVVGNYGGMLIVSCGRE